MAHIQCSFYSPTLQKNADVQVILPTTTADDYLYEGGIDYNRENGVYQTLYLLHGSYGDCTDWMRNTSIARYAEEHKVAVVMPSAENSCYAAMAHGENYLAYIGEELPRFMTAMFPLSKKRENTFVAGLSMGGYGAFRIAFAYPETFGFAGSISGGLDMRELNRGTEAHVTKMPPNYRKAVFNDPQNISDDNDLLYILKGLVDKNTALPQLYMCCGTEDFILPTNDAFHKGAAALGVTIPYDKHKGAHNWPYWDEHVQDVLNWLPLQNELVTAG